MPSLPRIRRTRPAAVLARPEPQIHEVEAHGLTWVHLDRVDVRAVEELAARFGWHELDLEDVMSKRQRPKIDEYPDYLFVVLHFPAYDKNIQRLNAGELDVDRKSTRLNSSHANISYAVFCLKKKKQNHYTHKHHHIIYHTST